MKHCRLHLLTAVEGGMVQDLTNVSCSLGAGMASFEDKAEKAYGHFVMVFLALLECGVFAFLGLYVLPLTSGWLRFLTIGGMVFFGAGALLFLLYLRPKKPLRKFARRDGSYFLARSRLAGLLGLVVALYMVVFLPPLALFTAFAIPYLFFTEPGAIFPALEDMNLWTLYQSWDTGTGLIFLLVPLLIGFPWLYWKFLKLLFRSLRLAFTRTGVKLDASGLSITGPVPIQVPWSWVERVEVVVHGHTDTLQLIGSEELDALRMKIDPRLPKSIRKSLEWTGQGLIVTFDFIPVRVREVAQVIRDDFLR